VTKAQGTVGGSEVKYSDISIKGLNVNSSSMRHTFSAGSYSGRGLGGGSSANMRHTISSGSGAGGGYSSISSGSSGSGSGTTGAQQYARRNTISQVNVRLDRREGK